jgi:hypothetical protein
VGAAAQCVQRLHRHRQIIEGGAKDLLKRGHAASPLKFFGFQRRRPDKSDHRD